MFERGDRVRTRRTGEAHTRLPRYLVARSGTVVAVLGAFRFADEAARIGRAARSLPLYTVEFDLGTHRVRADLFEPYLERC
jgi:hypothetical protein